MKQTPIHILIERLELLPLHHQIAHLRALVALERPYSVRRNDLESILREKFARQLRKETRAA